MVAVAASLLTVSPAAAQTAAGEASDAAPVVPNYWDPRRRISPPKRAEVKSIRFATTDDFPPFNFSGSDGRLAGFHIELARLVCEELVVPCSMRAVEWDALVPTIEEERADALIAGLRRTRQTAETLEFSDVYLRLPARFLAHRDTEADGDISPETIAGKSVAVVAGSAHAAFVETFFEDAALRYFDSENGARSALKDGGVDLHFGDGLSLSFWLNGTDAAGCCRFVGGPYTAVRYFGDGLRIAVARDNIVLRDALNYALQRLHEEGRFTELYLRYFPISFY